MIHWLSSQLLLWSPVHVEKTDLCLLLWPEHTLFDFRAKHAFHKNIRKFLPSLPGPTNAILLALAWKSTVQSVHIASKRGSGAYTWHKKESNDTFCLRKIHQRRPRLGTQGCQLVLSETYSGMHLKCKQVASSWPTGVSQLFSQIFWGRGPGINKTPLCFTVLPLLSQGEQQSGSIIESSVPQKLFNPVQKCLGLRWGYVLVHPS